MSGDMCVDGGEIEAASARLEAGDRHGNRRGEE